MASAIKAGIAGEGFKTEVRHCWKENETKAEKMPRAEKTADRSEPWNVLGLRRMTTPFLTPLRQVSNREAISPKFHLVKFKCLNEKLGHSKSIF